MIEEENDMDNLPFSDDEDDDNFTIDGDLTGNLPPEGDYIGKLIDLTKEESKAGNPMWVWEVELVSRVEYHSDEFAGWSKKVYTALTEAAMWKVNETLQAFGLGRVEDGRIKANFRKGQAMGTHCIMIIEHGEYNGQPTADIAKLLPHPEGAGYKPERF